MGEKPPWLTGRKEPMPAELKKTRLTNFYTNQSDYEDLKTLAQMCNTRVGTLVYKIIKKHLQANEKAIHAYRKTYLETQESLKQSGLLD